MSDLYESLLGSLNSNAALGTSFGRAGYIWRNLAPPAEVLPVAVLAHVATEIEAEPFSRTSRARTELKTFQVSVYDDDAEDADTLCRAVVEAVEAAALAGSVTFTTGTLIDIGRTGGESDQLDPEASPTGNDVWGRMIELQGMISRT
jgi:hypothetical protein